MIWNWNKIVGHGVPLLLAFALGIWFGIGAIAARFIPANPPAATILVGCMTASIATLALLIGWRTIRAARHNAKATVTFQHIARTQADGDFIKARGLLKQAVRAGDVAKWASAAEEGSDETAAINLILNDLEIIAIGIQRGIIDCPLFRSWCEQHVVKRWQETEPYVNALRVRQKHRSIFFEFEKMAKAWDTERPGYQYDPGSPFCKKGRK